MVMNIEESLTDLPTPRLPETPTLKVRKSNLSRQDICKFISGITKILGTVHCGLKGLKSTEKFQETDNFNKKTINN